MSATKNNGVGAGNGGPRTAAGKARTCRNALKHGLAACYKHDPLLLQQSRQLARAICGDDDNELLFEQALIVAECDQLLRRITAHRVVIIERLQDPVVIPVSKDHAETRMKVFKRVRKQGELAYSEFSQLKTKLIAQGENVVSFMNARRTKATTKWKYEPLKDREEFGMVREAIEDIERLRRYERRAWSRRNRAIREFISIKARAENEPADFAPLFPGDQKS
jgi:hypothetical protein